MEPYNIGDILLCISEPDPNITNYHDDRWGDYGRFKKDHLRVGSLLILEEIDNVRVYPRFGFSENTYYLHSAVHFIRIDHHV